jgi:hypothetical protein
MHDVRAEETPCLSDAMASEGRSHCKSTHTPQTEV